MICIPIEPVPKPRMTRSDAWKQRTAVVKFWAYKDALRSALKAEDIPDSYHVVFTLPMPASWSRKKRAAMLHQPHRSRPDKDNLEKGLLDALFEEDSHVWGRTGIEGLGRNWLNRDSPDRAIQCGLFALFSKKVQKPKPNPAGAVAIFGGFICAMGANKTAKPQITQRSVNLDQGWVNFLSQIYPKFIPNLKKLGFRIKRPNAASADPIASGTPSGHPD
jgi:Holliday junction resolvase RusA-like endonuclease